MKEFLCRGERRIWYDAPEIEIIASSELSRAGLLPTPEDMDVSVDIEAFVERHLGIALDQYAPLDPAVLGETTFAVGGPPRIAINRDLTGSALDAEDASPGLIGRWRATVAHEAAHVLLHRALYEVDERQIGLFGRQSSSVPSRLHRCLKRDVSLYGPVTDWREFQANAGMSALLMPHQLVVGVLRLELDKFGLPGEALARAPALRDELARRLSVRFRVSRAAAGLRLEALSAGQLNPHLNL